MLDIVICRSAFGINKSLLQKIQEGFTTLSLLLYHLYCFVLLPLCLL
jgi:hypothetical protein